MDTRTGWSILTLVLALIVCQCRGFVLHATSDVIETDLTHNVNLTCSYGGTTTINTLRLIRILKQEQPPNWNLVAEIEAGISGITLQDQNVIATGHVGALNASFLSLNWPTASSDTLGKYRCDFIGFMSNQDFVSEKTQEIVINERNVSADDVLSIVKEEDAEIRQEIQSLEKRVSQLEMHFVSLQSSLDHIVKLLQDLVPGDKQPSIFWPQGSYGIMASLKGCPANTGAPWTLGYRRHSTVSDGTNHDQVSPNNHLKQPVMEKVQSQNYFYQHFCTLNSSLSNISWPKGTYCFHRYGDFCPADFESGFIYFSEANTANATVSGTLPAGDYLQFFTDFAYCCRSDGPASSEIYLPNDQPFYLYRYQGHCQQVTGMSVSEESILIDTENMYNDDRYLGTAHPDGKAQNDVQIILCYYAPA